MSSLSIIKYIIGLLNSENCNIFGITRIRLKCVLEYESDLFFAALINSQMDNK